MENTRSSTKDPTAAPTAKGELRKARKAARAEGKPLSGELALDRGSDPVEFSETPRGYRARDRYARWCDSLNGAPAGDWDR